MPPTKKRAAPRKAAAKRAPTRRPGKRTSRAEQLRRQRERQSLKRRLVIAAGLLVVIAGAVLYARTRPEGDVVAEIEASGSCEYTAVPDGDPPAGGDTGDAEAAEPGFYRKGDPVPSDAALVKAMRRGFVVLWYREEARKAELEAAESLSDRFGRDLIVVPKSPLTEPLVVTAWERRLHCAQVDETSIARFTEAFRDKGPEKGFL